MTNIFVSGSMAYDEIMDFPHHFKDYFHPEKLHQINVAFAVSDLAKHLGGITTNISYALRNTVDYLSPTSVISTEPSLTRGAEKSQTSRSLDSKKSIGAARDDKIVIYPVAAVGRDGGELLDFCKKNNIDTSYIQQDKKLYTATGKVITDVDDNQIWGFYYGACIINPKLETLNSKQIKQNSKSKKERSSNLQSPISNLSQNFWIISATHQKSFTTALKYVIKNKLPYVFDPGMTLTWIKDELLRKGMMNATYMVGNDYEIAMIEKRLKMTVKEMVEKGVNVITTLGASGVRYLGRDVISSGSSLTRGAEKSQHNEVSPRVLRIGGLGRDDTIQYPLNSLSIPSVKLKKVVDPTGAGDAWRGGFVGALMSGKPIQECLIMGNVIASFAVESVGTVEYTVKDSEIHRRIKSISK